MRCPTCGSYARKEPGGIVCTRGHCFLLRRVLPRNHQLSGRDAQNRARQQCLDRSLVRPGRSPEFIFDLLERLEELETRR
jgi:hypothetical protein